MQVIFQQKIDKRHPYPDKAELKSNSNRAFTIIRAIYLTKWLRKNFLNQKPVINHLFKNVFVYFLRKLDCQ